MTSAVKGKTITNRRILKPQDWNQWPQLCYWWCRIYPDICGRWHHGPPKWFLKSWNIKHGLDNYWTMWLGISWKMNNIMLNLPASRRYYTNPYFKGWTLSLPLSVRKLSPQRRWTAPQNRRKKQRNIRVLWQWTNNTPFQVTDHPGIGSIYARNPGRTPFW